ncbi:MAG: MFS transporter [Ferrovum sp. 37-45-19]|uniref:MFS transporter n=1 Tax=Ferrovum sp. JA12 TaxID=1356299 RepID=UPI00070366CE|nr:MFS transporter [Ferrovum sp. JA12]OYV79492.1 MAG: MFS transporter [Ferrovum sp. 21-44-67]OYV94235.1 MAG: MFS transporter [Ferrovum sp. 37-45-19]OZB31733.1 MAG: MFS transporter [Ferrovum sp. 34-44-207]HQT81709.1 MFS transporter [Ferrovaceae bacterium]KRH78351.1 inner membrane transport protein YnfM [Ferrovum sp. JA12]
MNTTQLHSRAVLWLSVAAFSSAAANRICDPMLPSLVQHFQVSAKEASLVVSLFSVAYGFCQIIYGPLGDRVGKYRLIGIMTLLSTLGSLGAAMTGSMDGLYLFRLLAGATTAGIIPLSMAWIGDTIAYEDRQATLARFLAGQVLGVIGGQFIGGLFTDKLGYQYAFYFMALCYLLIGLGVYWESTRNTTTYHLRHQNAIHGGIVKQSLMVLSTPWARVVLFIVFMEGVLVFGPLAFIPSYLHHTAGLSLTQGGLVMMSFGVGGFSYTFFARFFVALLGEVGLSVMGGGLLGLGWLLIAAMDGWLVVIPASYLLGMGYYMIHNTMQTNATQMTPQVRGTAVSLFASLFFLGQSLGVVLSAQWLSQWHEQGLFLLVAIALPVLGALFAYLIKQHQRREAG